MIQCDLHTHSNYSDGTLTPKQLICCAEQAGLGAVALCDHNTIAGLPEFVSAGQASTVETVPGIEFSTDYSGTELHLIMLFVKPQDYAPITSLVSAFRSEKEKSNAELVRALQKSGIPIQYEALLQMAPDGYVNRAHIAAELTRLGYASSISDGFRKYLKPEGGYYNPPKRPDVFMVLKFIRELGGVSVLAHPLLNLSADELCVFLNRAAANGLDAMETVYSRYDADEILRSRALAAEYGLLESGGSDFHGANKPDISMADGTGDLMVDICVLNALKRRNENYNRNFGKYVHLSMM